MAATINQTKALHGGNENPDVADNDALGKLLKDLDAVLKSEAIALDSAKADALRNVYSQLKVIVDPQGDDGGRGWTPVVQVDPPKQTKEIAADEYAQAEYDKLAAQGKQRQFDSRKVNAQAQVVAASAEDDATNNKDGVGFSDDRSAAEREKAKQK